MRDCDVQDFTSDVDFLYNGEVNILSEKLVSLLQLAEHLKIKGLPQKDMLNCKINSTNGGTFSMSAGNFFWVFFLVQRA